VGVGSWGKQEERKKFHGLLYGIGIVRKRRGEKRKYIWVGGGSGDPKTRVPCLSPSGFVDLDIEVIIIAKNLKKKIHVLKSWVSSFGDRLLLELESPSWGKNMLHFRL
jgi:hypothetical protein